MLEPVQLADFFAVFLSAALVILCGAAYALLFAWSRLKARPRLAALAYVAGLGLCAAVLTLAVAAHLFNSGFWIFIVVLMLVGYLAAPHAIWHLCVGTHGNESADAAAAHPHKVYQQQ